MRFFLNKTDFKLITKQPNAGKYVRAILNIFAYNYDIQKFMSYIDEYNLYEKIGISKQEMLIYVPRYAMLRLEEFLTGDKDKDPYLYNLCLKIHSKTQEGLIKIIMKFAIIKKEIPEFLIKKYMKYSDSFSNIFGALVLDLIDIMVEPPDLLIKAALFDDKLFNRKKTFHSNILELYSYYETEGEKYSLFKEIVQNVMQKIERFQEEGFQIDDNEPEITESFKSFFYKNI